MGRRTLADATVTTGTASATMLSTANVFGITETASAQCPVVILLDLLYRAPTLATMLLMAIVTMAGSDLTTHIAPLAQTAMTADPDLHYHHHHPPHHHHPGGLNLLDACAAATTVDA